MFQSKLFKKILPGILVIVILAIGIFGIFGVETVHAKISTGCIVGLNLDKCVTAVSATVANLMLEVFSWISSLAGWMLDKSVTYTVIEMGAHVNGTEEVAGIGAIDEGWKVFRDLANIALIFVLLAIGIATILRLESYGVKTLLAKLVIVALLINFSLFFTQVVIDSSNLLAKQFYDKITTVKNDIGESTTVGVGSQFAVVFRLPSVFDTDSENSLQFVKTKEDGSQNVIKWHQVFLIGMLGSVVFLVAGFAFFAGSLLLIIRFVVLILLMIISPLAFAAWVLPGTKTYANLWWSTLFKYAIFAPIFLLLTWFVLMVAQSPAFQNSIGLGKSSTFSGLAAGGKEAIANMNIVLNFVIIITFLIASIIIANQMGIYSSATMMKWGNSARKWGQGFVGRRAMRPVRAARRLAGTQAEKMLESKKGSARFARLFAGGALGKAGAAKRADESTAKKKYESLSTAALRDKAGKVTTSFADKAAIRKILMSREKGNIVAVAKHFAKLDSIAQREAYLSMKPKDQIALEKQLEKDMQASGSSNTQIKDKLDELQGYLSKDETGGRKKVEQEEESKEKVRDVENNINININNSARIQNELRSLTPKQVRDLPADLLEKTEVSQHLSIRDFNAILKEDNLTNAQRDKMRNDNPNHPFFDPVNNPASKLW